MFGKTYEVIAYSADADIICPECAAKLYGVKHDTYLPKVDGLTDNEGNPVRPVFLDNERLNSDSDMVFRNAFPVCGNCWDELDV